MPRKKRTKRQKLDTAGRRLTAPAQAVMRAFRAARASASPFVSTCGVFPEVSEPATDQLHAIVNDVATQNLDKARLVRSLQRKLRRLAAAANPRHRPKDIVERIGGDLTALLSSEATAAYLFGVSVGMTIRTLPERIDR